MEEAFRQWRRDQRPDAHSAGGFAEDRHARRIATEARDVALHPPQYGNLVEETVVTRSVVRRLCRECRVRQKTEGTEPIVEGDDDRTLFRQPRTVMAFFAAETGKETTAVDPDQDGARGARTGDRERARPDVEIEAVFRNARRKRIDIGVRAVLNAV